MKKYIDTMILKRDLAIANILDDKRTLTEIIDAVPAADVKEVVHGKWIVDEFESYIPVEYDYNGELIVHKYTNYKCSICGRTEKEKEPYCNCGAQMDL